MKKLHTKKKKVDLVILQYSVGDDIDENFKNLIKKINNIKISKNTTIVIGHELSYLKYFPITKDIHNKKYAISMSSKIFKDILSICINKKIFFLFSFFEKSKKKLYNSVALISPHGIVVGKYRKKNIPDEECYQEEYYFNKSENKHEVIDIGVCKIGLMICWDQWYSESYQQINKLGADLILCPTSIGYSYKNNKCISLTNEKNKWVNTITANSLMINTPIVIVNRTGYESSKQNAVKFWGSSFVTNSNGDITFMNKSGKTTSYTTIDLAMKKISVKSWGFYKNSRFNKK